MAPNSAVQLLLSPAELSFLHTSLALNQPIRPDGRSPTQFRPLIAEKDVVPSANGSARVCFADGTEAIVGIKAQVEKTDARYDVEHLQDLATDIDAENDEPGAPGKGQGESEWVEMTIDIPGCRDDDTLPIFLSNLLMEALLAGGEVQNRLWINRRFHWKLYIDVLLLSAPLSYPLPLLSIATHLALLTTRLPKLVSEGDQDPLFDDDWEASTYLYPSRSAKDRSARPTISILVIAVGNNILFDPSKEELAVAESVMAISIGFPKTRKDKNDLGRILSMRSIDPPSRLTPPGIPNSVNTTTSAQQFSVQDVIAARESSLDQGVWNPPRGGLPRLLVKRIMASILGPDGIIRDIIAGLDAGV